MITKSAVRHAYAFLRTLPPFKEWRLPTRIEVKISNKTDVYGAFEEPNIITISKTRIWDVDALVRTVAHEMAHLYQFKCGLAGDPPYHNEAFYEIAREICRELGWKEETF